MDRTEILLEWARALLMRGEVPPNERALREIGARGAIPGQLRTPDVDRWARVIQHLLWLINQNHPQPVADALRLGPDGPPPTTPRSQPSAPVHQPSAPVHQPSGPVHQPSAPVHQLSAPAPPVSAVPPPRPTSPTSTPVTEPEPEPERPVESPREKIQRLMMWRDAEGFDELKDRHIRQIVNSEPRVAAEVAASLPGSLKQLAERIAVELGLDAAPRHAESGPGIDPEATRMVGRADLGNVTAPAPQRRIEDPNDGVLTWTDPVALEQELNEFAPVDLSIAPAAPGRLRAAPTRDDEGVRLTWEAVDAPYVEYRVVSDDDHTPISPDHADVIALTRGTTLTDTRPPATAVRHYRVWANPGSSAATARAEQPVLVAETSVVTRPLDVVIREDEGRVIGQWSLPRGVKRVLVFRVPQERAAGGTGNPEFRICANEANLGGFVDYHAEPGHKYYYQLQVEAEGSSQLSFPVNVAVTTSAVLEPVTDLDCQLGDDGLAQFTLSWTPPPIGTVEIFRTERGPRSGADNDTVSAEALPQMGLADHDQLAHPVQPAGDRATMVEVPWPRGWSRTYFTPVTMLDGQARVGRTISRVRTAAVSDAKIIERVTQQVLTMSWPSGAANVKVYSGPIGQSAAEVIASTQPIAEISADAYERFGGLHFPEPLDPLGCDLHLVSVAFTEGTSVEGKPTTITYHPLLKIWYHVAVQPAADGQPWAMVALRTELPQQGAPPMALVHNPQRLPLDIRDGQALSVMPQAGGQASQRFYPRLGPDTGNVWWAAPLPGPGWVRLFIEWPDPDLTVAVLDPTVDELQVGPR